MDITAIYWIIGDTSHTKQFTSVTGKSKQFEPLGLNLLMQSLTHFPFFLLLTELNGVHYLAPVVQKVDSAIQRINRYPVDSAIGFPNTYPLDSNYPMDSAIQRMNNPGLEDKNVPIT